MDRVPLGIETSLLHRLRLLELHRERRRRLEERLRDHRLDEQKLFHDGSPDERLVEGLSIELSRRLVEVAAPEVDLDTVLELDAVLSRLEAISPRQAKAVELRFFGGLTLEETAEVLGTSAPTAMRDLRFAQAWLARELAG
jgi:RNA polymerase sigma factor (sigma-70 family)